MASNTETTTRIATMDASAIARSRARCSASSSYPITIVPTHADEHRSCRAAAAPQRRGRARSERRAQRAPSASDAQLGHRAAVQQLLRLRDLARAEEDEPATDLM